MCVEGQGYVDGVGTAQQLQRQRTLLKSLASDYGRMACFWWILPGRINTNAASNMLINAFEGIRELPYSWGFAGQDPRQRKLKGEQNSWHHLHAQGIFHSARGDREAGRLSRAAIRLWWPGKQTNTDAPGLATWSASLRLPAGTPGSSTLGIRVNWNSTDFQWEWHPGSNYLNFSLDGGDGRPTCLPEQKESSFKLYL